MWTNLDESAAALAKTTLRWDLLLWALFISVLAFTHTLIYLLAKADDYGFATIRTGKDFKKLQVFNTMAIQLPLNALAGTSVFGSDYVRKCLIAPPQDMNWNPRGDNGYQSLQAWWKTTLIRRILWITLALTSLPIHFLYNSIIISTLPAYDAYEVMVDERFFRGEPFDVSTINMTQFEFEPGAPMPFNTSWPGEWPGSNELQQNLKRVQQDPSSWTNLSNPDCRTKYGLETYSTYRTVILVTNWTQNLPHNNSALAVGALPGFPPTGVPDRFMSLCPEAYLSTTPNATFPPSDPESIVKYIGTSDLPSCSKVNGPDCSSFSFHGRDASISPHANYDLCESYHPSNVTYNVSQQLSLAYCLSEPLKDINARLVWSRVITKILALAFGVKPTAMILAWFCVRRSNGFPNGFPWSAFKEKIRGCGMLSVGNLLVYLFINACITGLTFFLDFSTKSVLTGPFGGGSSPASPTDSNFILSFLVFQNIIHTVMVIREYLESNWFEGREMKRNLKPRLAAPLPVMLFLWNLGLHQLVSAWLSTAMFDRYPIGSLGDPTLRAKPTLIQDSVMSGHIGSPLPFKNSTAGAIVILFIPPLATILQMIGVQCVYFLCGRRPMNDLDAPEQPVSGSSHSLLSDEDNSLRQLPRRSSVSTTGILAYMITLDDGATHQARRLPSHDDSCLLNGQTFL